MQTAAIFTLHAILRYLANESFNAPILFPEPVTKKCGDFT